MKNKKHHRSLKTKLIYLCSILVLAIVLIPLLFSNLSFGLDLQGGFEVLYQIDTLDGTDLSEDMLTSTYKAILKRIDILGVSEPSITIEGDNKIRVQLAGVTDIEQARSVLSQTATLTFRNTKDELLMSSEVLSSGGAQTSLDEKGFPSVSLNISDTNQFYKVTKQISESDENMLVIWLDFEEGVDTYATAKCGVNNDSRCLSAATVSQGFSSSSVQITSGSNASNAFSQEEVQSLVDLINSGSLPTKLTEISSQTVDASFGVNSLNKTMIAGIVGIILIIGFMIFLYRFSGFIASVGIVIYALLTFSLFWLVGGVLTLPGIAAILLGIGMAVDANVINFSRIKDEYKNKKDLQIAYKKGNKSSLSTVIDANITTLIVAVILFIFGESSVKGFATMLIISILTTMFVMVFLVRKTLDKMVATDYFNDKPKQFIGFKESNDFDFNIVKNRKRYFLLTIILIIIGVISLTKMNLNLGIEFKGGSSITVKSNNEISESDIINDVKSLKFEYGSSNVIDENTVSVTINDNLDQDEVISTENYFSDKYEASTDISVISNIVKKELIKNALYSLIIAIVGIILYISVRFKFGYAISAIVCLLHDAFIVLAVFSLIKLEVSTIFIAAILSIIGYSVNNTIVTFDRIKENIHKKDKISSKEELESIIDDSINQTVNRSLITTATTLIPIICLILLGANEIINFNVALLIGLTAGTYSSLFIAGSLFYVFEKRNIGKEKKKKWYEID